MLVEDDKSLREIYGVRLLAEGYDIVSADNGEEALAVAIKERPSLIIADVMMPKISGFDMLDILRSTTETRNVKVIIMTALSSEEQRNRGIQLGADKYLVKSQVGIEDVVRVVHEVLGDAAKPAATAAQAASSVSAASPAPIARPASVPSPQPITRPAMPSPATAGPTPQPAAPAVNRGVAAPISVSPSVPPTRPIVTTPPQLAPQAPNHPTTLPPSPHVVRPVPTPASTRTHVIQPLNNPTASKVDINELLDRELAKEAGLSESQRPAVATTEQEKAIVSNQLNALDSKISASPAPTTPPPAGAPSIQIDTSGNVTGPGTVPTPPPKITPPTQ